MGDEKFSTLLRIAIVPQITDLIVRENKVSDVEAAKIFYKSKTYELLSKEETKLWHYSPLTLYNVWREENTTGEVILPEEAL